MRRHVIRLALVWFALIALLATTVAASFAPLGSFSPVVSTGIAIAKAALVFWFFMHLREESGLLRVVAVGAGVWLLILFLLTSSDFATRGVLQP